MLQKSRVTKLNFKRTHRSENGNKIVMLLLPEGQIIINKLFFLIGDPGSACFPHFLKTSSERPDFTEFIFENGCCRRIFGNVSAKIKE